MLGTDNAESGGHTLTPGGKKLSPIAPIPQLQFPAVTAGALSLSLTEWQQYKATLQGWIEFSVYIYISLAVCTGAAGAPLGKQCSSSITEKEKLQDICPFSAEPGVKSNQ